MQFPRARHDARRLANGRVLVTGGQEAVTVILPPQPGFPGIQFTQEARPSIEIVEIFDPAALAFHEATDTAGNPAELTTPRGRAGNTTAQFAGIDNLLNTGDDVYGIIGGFMTLSALSLAAPQDYYPWNFDTTKLTSMDFYDPVTGTMNLAQGLVLSRRVNDPIAVNLGQDHPATPFGELGMANTVLILGGDTDENCPDGTPGIGEGNADRAELVIATFTGFGPGNGIRFAVMPQEILANPNCLAGGIASVFAAGSERVLGCCGFEFNRSRTGAVLMDMVRTFDGQTFITSVVACGGGSDQTPVPGGCAVDTIGLCPEGEIRGFDFYDPFYDAFHAATTGEAPWDWADNATATNPLGIRGAVLAYDAEIPSEDLTGYALDNNPTVSMNQGRAMHTVSRIPGEDGLLGTLDDRIAMIGGSAIYWPTFGDDALNISCEIFLPPNAGIVP
jgi:hypothetical protein